MDLLSGYCDSDEEELKVDNKETATTTTTTTKTPVEFKEISTFKPNLTPSVDSIRVLENRINPNDKVLTYNPTWSSMAGDVEGPNKPYSQSNSRMDSKYKNHTTGIVEEYHVNDYAFTQQYYSFKTKGYAINPDGGNELVGYRADDNTTTTTTTNNNSKDKKDKRKRESNDPSNIEQFKGPWAPKQRELALKAKIEDEMNNYNVEEATLTEEQKAFLDSRIKKQKPKSADNENEIPEITSVFHGKERKDYMGRDWLEHPSDLRLVVPDTYLPKKLIHTWTGHTKGIAAIRLFPKYGHMLLSAGMDNTVKIWDVYNERKCMQTYTGHTAAVRDICFSNDGRSFLSCGYDRVSRLWDTETGKIVGTYNNGKIPFCLKFNPDDDKQNLFIVGDSGKKIVQWDIKSNEIVQEYDQHLGAVNTLTFIDNNRRFVSSSDDKSLRIWEWGIPVVIKYVSEPEMHSMPAVAVHPNGKWFITQSMDNQILVYSTQDRFRMNKKKRFLGHNCAGYACQVGFSPDGKYVISGDANGRAFFWEWKTSKMFKTLNAHDGVCIGVEWNPLESSKVITCGWDGKIKYWD
ncbi:hypothetical protein CYY_001788 [Polysphondylium violaceum]|uniref:Pre-mRNA-processing factor 17 n=1 Tax=Polysphondylium violaceum TaxID=133409 RepID=A0A8J4Q8P9_9MYCE|nr:hypothetical protein CYY_001788 [Polysphondylium violaceum]